MPPNTTRRQLWVPLVCLVVLAVSGSAAYSGWYDLFAAVPEVHQPRVVVGVTERGAPTVRAEFDVPTTTSAAMVLGGCLAALGATEGLWRWWTRKPAGGLRFWALPMIGLGVAAIAWLVYALDFLGTAFEGVG